MTSFQVSNRVINIRQKALIFCYLACCMLVSCSTSLATSSSPDQLPVVQVTPTSSPTIADSFYVDVWVNNPTPSQNDKVILFGMLNKNGVFLSGIMMEATWPDENQSRGIPNCYIQLSYARGVCIIDAGKFPSGKYVPVQVLFEYEGQRFTGESGFTPK
jgi:hypothetical protein